MIATDKLLWRSYLIMKKITAIIITAALLCGCSAKNDSSTNSKPSSGSTSASDQNSGNSTESSATEPFSEIPFDYSFEEPIEGTDTDMSEIANVSWDKIAYMPDMQTFISAKNYFY